MKTHAVRENRILKSFDFVLIVLTMSFVSFMILKSIVFYPDFTNHSKMGTSLKVEFPVLEQKAISVINENTAQESTMINAGPKGNAVNKEESEKAETESVSVKRNMVTAVEGGLQSEAAMVHQSLNITAKSVITETVPVTDSHSEKTNLEQWIKSRDDWEQK
jgi:hypothetical protein